MAHPYRVLVTAFAVLMLGGCPETPRAPAPGAPRPATGTPPAAGAPPGAGAPPVAGTPTAVGTPPSAAAAPPVVAPPKALSNVETFVSPPPAPKPAQPGAVAAPPTPKPAPPMSLTGSDGSGLELRKLTARAVVEGPLAFTELHMTFHNPESRRREGRFAITLPSGAAISRFAMNINGHWMEGEVVEKQRARQIYEDFLHRRQDPAILEQDAGNTFRARVFPIEPNADKELIVSYSHELTDLRHAYTLPLAGLPTLQELSIRAFVHGGPQKQGGSSASSLGGDVGAMQVVSVDKRGFQPTADFEVYPAFLQSPFDGLRADDVAMARLVVGGGAIQADGFENVVVLFDTSASEAPRYEAAVDQLAAFVAHLGAAGAKAVTVVAFDQEAATVFQGAPAGFGSKEKQKLLNRGALGASDLTPALAAARAAATGGRWRVVLFTNGVMTAGPRTPDALKEAVAALSSTGIERLDTVTTTTARDDNTLAALVTAGLKRDGINLALAPSDRTFARLGIATFKPISVKVPGAKWAWPDKLVGLQPGQAVLVFAELPADKPFRIDLSGGHEGQVTPQTRSAAKPLLQRAWVAARWSADRPRAIRICGRRSGRRGSGCRSRTGCCRPGPRSWCWRPRTTTGATGSTATRWRTS